MAPIPDNEKLLIEITTRATVAAGGSGARPVDFVTHWRRAATVNPFSKSQCDTAYQAAIAVPLFAALNLTCTQQYNQIRVVNDAQDAFVGFSHAVVGSITGDRMSVVNAAFLLLKTGFRGRSYKGSKHLGPMSESDSTTGTDDVWNAGCLARLATIAAAILAGFTDAGPNVYIPSVFSRSLSQYQANPTTIVATDVSSVLVNKRIGTMIGRRVPSVY